MNILGELGVEYDSFVVPITSMPGTFSMPEITALLLTHEARIEQHSQTEMLSVNLASNNQGFNQNNNQVLEEVILKVTLDKIRF